MFQLINDILALFRQCFNREKTWNWFVCAVIGLMLRVEQRGVTSIISTLRIEPRLYETLLHFFRSSGYAIENIYRRWAEILQRYVKLYEVDGRLILLGDHTKVSKEGRRMPCVSTHRQESENSGKPEYIQGHCFGFIAALAMAGATLRSIPMLGEIQEGKAKTGGPSLVEQMVECGGRLVRALQKPAIMVLDAYFCSGMTFKTSDSVVDSLGNRMLEIITRAKSDTVAFAPPPAAGGPRKPGRPRKYGKRIVLRSLFASEADMFTETSILLYGKMESVRFLSRDLFWKPCDRFVRFVLVELGGNRLILMSSDLTLAPSNVIMLYGIRFKIETGFRDLKGDIGCFNYHFWTFSQPKKPKWKDAALPSEPKALAKIAKAKNAIEMHVCLSCIAAGILTIIAISLNQQIWQGYSGWLRTVRSKIPSIATTRHVVFQELLPELPYLSHLPVFSCIAKKQRSRGFLYRNVG